MSMSLYARNQLLGLLVSGKTLYVSLHTGSPGDSGSSEVTDKNYARQAASFNVDSSTGAATLGGALTWKAVAAALTVTHVALYDAANGGNQIARQALKATTTYAAGDTPTIAAGDLTLRG
ncbi:hypothetical protein SB18R_03270 [Pseudomonas oryzihabitans]|nr:hypothetical protein SB9_12505 [Pseudomonas psychrotolerans]KTT78264.1 hypothetical protein SB18R_03270 [Pseudomonas psychrotolerans]